MKKAAFIIAALSLIATADSKTAISGIWKLNAGKSILGAIPAPASLIRRVVHRDPLLIVSEEQKGGFGDHLTTRHYTTDGKETTFLENGTNVKARAYWEGNSLVIESTADAGGVTIVFVERMTLSNGNNTLIDALHIATPQGEFDATYSFDRR